MAKRFIDTEMFEDEWFSNLSKDGKLFFVYFITNCDHAGILKVNRKLITFQTDIKNIDTVINELGNSLVRVNEEYLFMPKFIKFQYPDFPKSTVKQQYSALKILISFGLYDDKTNSYIRVNKELNNYYDNVIVNDSVNVTKGKTLFRNSIYFDKAKFKEALPDWNKAKLLHYYESALNWSDSNGKGKIDWIATVKIWARKDEKEGKTFDVKQVNHNLQGTL